MTRAVHSSGPSSQGMPVKPHLARNNLQSEHTPALCLSVLVDRDHATKPCSPLSNPQSLPPLLTLMYSSRHDAPLNLNLSSPPQSSGSTTSRPLINHWLTILMLWHPDLLIIMASACFSTLSLVPAPRQGRVFYFKNHVGLRFRLPPSPCWLSPLQPFACCIRALRYT